MNEENTRIDVNNRLIPNYLFVPHSNKQSQNRHWLVMFFTIYLFHQYIFSFYYTMKWRVRKFSQTSSVLILSSKEDYILITYAKVLSSSTVEYEHSELQCQWFRRMAGIAGKRAQNEQEDGYECYYHHYHHLHYSISPYPTDIYLFTRQNSWMSTTRGLCHHGCSSR